MAVLLVEHHVPMVMSVCDRIVALHFGCQIAEGAPHEVMSNPEVVAAYMGAASAVSHGLDTTALGEVTT